MAGARSSQRRQQTLGRRQTAPASRESGRSLLIVLFEDLHWIDSETQAMLESLVESLPTSTAAPAGELSSGIPAWLGKQDLLHPTAA